MRAKHPYRQIRLPDESVVRLAINEPDGCCVFVEYEDFFNNVYFVLEGALTDHPRMDEILAVLVAQGEEGEKKRKIRRVLGKAAKVAAAAALSQGRPALEVAKVLYGDDYRPGDEAVGALHKVLRKHLVEENDA